MVVVLAKPNEAPALPAPDPAAVLSIIVRRRIAVDALTTKASVDKFLRTRGKGMHAFLVERVCAALVANGFGHLAETTAPTP